VIKKAEFNLNNSYSFLGSNTACSLNNNSLNSKYCGSYLGMSVAMGIASTINQPICGKKKQGRLDYDI
jgi:hypothetical protein